MSATSELQSDFSFCQIFTEFYKFVMRMRLKNRTMVLKRSGIHLGDRSQSGASILCCVEQHIILYNSALEVSGCSF